MSRTNGAGEISLYGYDDNLTDGLGFDATYGARLVGLGFGPGSDGSAVTVTNAAGESMVSVSDGLGRSVMALDGNGNGPRTEYDLVVAGAPQSPGALVQTAVIDALGHVTSQRADGAGRVLEATDALGNMSKMAVDAAGNRVSMRDPNGVGQDCIYDARNRLTDCTDTKSDHTGTTYDAAGNVTSMTDGLGIASGSTYDGRNRKLSTIDRIAATTTYAYDGTSNLMRIIDDEGGVTAYVYDERNLLTSESFPGAAGGTRSYSYDPGRRLATRTDQTGMITTYLYDNANRLIRRQYPDGKNDVFTFDTAGRLTDAVSTRYQNTVHRGYDPAGRLMQESLTVLANPEQASTVAYQVSYGYDNDNRQVLLSYPDGSQATRAYTDRNQLAGVAFSGQSVATRTYDDGGRLTSTTLGNGIVEQRTYFNDNRVHTITAPGVTAFTYAYDAAKRKTLEADGILAQSDQVFGYDFADRLVSWSRGGADTQAWTLSPVGDWQSTTRNQVTETRTHNAVHETTSIAGSPLTYDPKGNLNNDGTGKQFDWDVENRLAAAHVAGSDSGYAYDALGRRVSKTVDGLTTTYVSAGAQEIYEVDTDQSVFTDNADSMATATRPRGGILDGADVTRINFQPAASTIPDGFLADTGLAFGSRSAGLNYGWRDGVQAHTVQRDRVALPMYDTVNLMQAPTEANGVWEFTLPNGDYPVIVIMGDAANLDMVNDVSIEGTSSIDADPYDPNHDYGYELGDFDGYAVIAHVSDGKLTISPSAGSSKATICFIEIGVAGGVIDAATQARLDRMILRMTAATAETPAKIAVRKHVYGSYVDEPLMLVSSGVKYYLHSNHLYSVAAITDSTGAVQERYRYGAYGKRTVLSGSGALLTSSAIGNQIGFTGRWHDATGMMYFRARYYEPVLGRFVSRDPIGYMGGGMSMYAGYMVPNSMDPTGYRACLPNPACLEMLNEIKMNAAHLASDLSRYDPITDAAGGFPIHGDPNHLSRPGGHYEEIFQRRNGLKRKITRYLKSCIDCDDPCDPDPNAPKSKRLSVPRYIDELINRQIERPITGNENGTSYLSDYGDEFVHGPGIYIAGAGVIGLTGGLAGPLILGGGTAAAVTGTTGTVLMGPGSTAATTALAAGLVISAGANQ